MQSDVIYYSVKGHMVGLACKEISTKIMEGLEPANTPLFVADIADNLKEFGKAVLDDRLENPAISLSGASPDVWQLTISGKNFDDGNFKPQPDIADDELLIARLKKENRIDNYQINLRPAQSNEDMGQKYEPREGNNIKRTYLLPPHRATMLLGAMRRFLP